jgi:hypothetical protein
MEERNDMATKVEEIKARILQRLESGGSTKELEEELQEELGQALLRQQAAGEVAKLQTVATRRAELRQKASQITAKVERQNTAVDSFMAARDEATKALREVFPKLAAIQRLQDDCRVFPSPVDFTVETRKLPAGYLAANLVLDSLSSGVSEVSSQELTAGALFHLQKAAEILEKATAMKTGLPHLLPEEVTV